MRATELYARPSPGYEARLAQARSLLVQAARAHAPLKQASSLGAEDMVITHLVQQLELDIPVFVLDTGMLHAQTLEMVDRLKATLQVPVQVYRPDAAALARFVDREGRDAMYRSVELRKACCHVRKVEPLQRALEGQRAWITGLRREQSAARADVPLVDTSEPRIKFNPLADWTWGDVWHCIATEGIAYHPLHDDFYPSIGCAPCTRAISLGEDFRAGRWWWENESAKECGLHVKPEGEAA